MPSLFDEILATLNSCDRSIPKSTLLSWMQLDDLEELALVTRFVLEKKHVDRIVPPLNFVEAFPFLFKYFERCLFEDPQSDWAATRYEAGREITFLIKSLWGAGELSVDALNSFKEWLAKLYRSGNSDLRECIVNAILEHLFEETSLIVCFDDWKNDSDLAPAYAAAVCWNDCK